MTETKRVCAIVGAGAGNGAALARRFAADGWRVALLSRDAGKLGALAAAIPGAKAFAADASDPASLAAALGAVAADLGPIEALIYNAGSGAWGDALSTSEADFEASWRVNALGGFAAARAVLPAMRAAGAGVILFIGATASLRGGAKTTAFAAAKAAQRSLAQSLARAYGPDGVHVALMIVDGVIDSPSSRARMPDKPDAFFLQANAIADAAATLAAQDPSAWTFELDLRPFGEHW